MPVIEFTVRGGLTYNHSVGTVGKWEVYTKYTLHAIPNLGKL